MSPTDPVGIAFKRHRRLRSQTMTWGFAFTAAVGFALVNIVDPYSGSLAAPAYAETAGTATTSAPTQSFTVSSGSRQTVTRDSVSAKAVPLVSAPATTSSSATAEASTSAPAAGTPDPGSAQAIALQILQARGMGQDQFSCLVSLWDRESGWNVYAHSGSGAYGIPQALPGSKMSSSGPDWQSNPATQITWGLNYISGRYSTPCGAWAHSQATGWY